MKRSTFKPRTPQREARDPDRLRSVPAVTPGAFRAPQPVAIAPSAPIAKDNPVRSQQYLRLVAWDSNHRTGRMPGQLPENTMNTPAYRQPTHREELERELVRKQPSAKADGF